MINLIKRFATGEAGFTFLVLYTTFQATTLAAAVSFGAADLAPEWLHDPRAALGCAALALPLPAIKICERWLRLSLGLRASAPDLAAARFADWLDRMSEAMLPVAQMGAASMFAEGILGLACLAIARTLGLSGFSVAALFSFASAVAQLRIAAETLRAHQRDTHPAAA